MPRTSRPSRCLTTTVTGRAGAAASTTAAAAALAAGGLRHRVRIEDRLPDRRDGELARGRQVGTDRAAAPVDVVARRARALAEEDRLTRDGVAAHRGRRGGRTAIRRHRREAPDVGDELPDLLIGDVGIRVHLGARHAVLDRAEQPRIVAAVLEGPRVQGRSLVVADAIAAVTIRTEARRTGACRLEWPRGSPRAGSRPRRTAAALVPPTGSRRRARRWPRARRCRHD